MARNDAPTPSYMVSESVGLCASEGKFNLKRRMIICRGGGCTSAYCAERRQNFQVGLGTDLG